MIIIDFNIPEKYKFDFDFDIEENSKNIFKTVVEEEKLKYDLSVNISIVSSLKIKNLNKKERNIDKVTDVLSFPNINFKIPSHIKKSDISIMDLNNKTIFLGDVVICYNKIVNQSKLYNHSIKREYCFLLTHSLFHLLGYDHMCEKDEKKMFGKQNKILEKLGIVN